MKKILLITLGVIALWFTSCSTCEKEKNLFHQDYQNYAIQIEDNMELGAFMDHMDSLYCVERNDINWPVIMFDAKKEAFVQSGTKAQLIGIEPTPCVEVEFDLTQILEIIKDDNNYEIEGQRIPLDSVPAYIVKHYLNYGKDSRFSRSPEGVGIWVISKSSTQMKELIPLMEKVTEGFGNVCKQYCQDQFDKKLCKTSEEEYAQMKELFPFHLAFKTYDREPEIKISW